MFGSKKRAKEQEDAASTMKALAAQSQAATTAAIETASKPDPITQRIMGKATALDDWEAGKSGPIDLRKMPGAGPQIALYEAAKGRSDAGRVGRGLNTMDSGANPNYVAQLDKENELDRDLNASGQLENEVNSALATKDQVLGNLAQIGEGRQMNIANLLAGKSANEQANWLRMVLRPREQGFLESLARVAVPAAISGVTGGFGAGGAFAPGGAFG